MDLRPSDSSFARLKISIAGGLVVPASLLFYQSIIYSYPATTGKVQMMEATAYVVIAAALIGMSFFLVGITRFFIRSLSRNRTINSSSTVMILSLALNDKRSFCTFILGSLLYGIFFALVSSSLVYQPVGRFSETYGVGVPSILPVLCCGSFGQMPQFVVYLTEQFALLIVPANLILLMVISWLVGLNVAIATYSYNNRSNNGRSKLAGGLGAIVGVFGVCPTCAGFFFLTTIGLAGAVSLALTLSSLQVVFLAVGLPMLLLTPITTARKMQNVFAPGCRLPGNREPSEQEGS